MDIEAGHIWPGMLISGQESRGRVVDVAEVAKNIGGSILRVTFPDGSDMHWYETDVVTINEWS